MNHHRARANPSAFIACVLILPCVCWSEHATEGALRESNPPSPASSSVWAPFKRIDFSVKHAVMIRNEDGTLTPMDVPYYRATVVAQGVWRIESDGDFHYLIEGDNEALAIDTGYGAGNLREYLQTLTSKPVRYVANTHNHFDHTANNAYFDKAFMSAETAKTATVPYASFSGMNFPRGYPKQIIADGYLFQLGNREVEVFLVPNHTTGGTAFLDKRSRILFSGDEIFQGGITISPVGSVAQYERNMSKLFARRSEFDRLATGGFGVIDANWVDRFLANTRYILAGHEGGPVAQRQRPPAVAPESGGEITYRRRFPRPGDGGASNVSIDVYQRTMIYADSSVTYDIRHVRD